MESLLKKILLEKINDEAVIYNISDFLKTYGQPKSNFDHHSFDELKLYLMLEYHKYRNLSNLFEEDRKIELLKSISVNLTKEQFASEIQKLHLISTTANISLEQLVHNAFNR